MPMKAQKQRITIVNKARGTEARLLLDRQSCRLSIRQTRECFQKLSVPGAEGGELGEFPLEQAPPECGGEVYRVIRVGKAAGSLSNVYFLPVDAIPSLLKSVGSGAAA